MSFVVRVKMRAHAHAFISKITSFMHVKPVKGIRFQTRKVNIDSNRIALFGKFYGSCNITSKHRDRYDRVHL